MLTRFWAGSALPVLLLLLQPVICQAQQSATLADPLSLEVALQYADKTDQYQIQSAEERLQQAIAEASLVSSDNDIRVNLSGRLRHVVASELGDEDGDDDSLVSLFVRKSLYDFGKSHDEDSLTAQTVELRQLEKAYLIEQRELAIMQRYFDVLNADNEYLRHNEDLAIGFIDWDRARERQQLGLASELEVKQRQAEYEIIRQNRYNSENLQRMTRVLLAEELGFPGQPPSEVSVPELRGDAKVSDDVDQLVEQAFRHSLLMKIQHKKLDIAMQEIELARHTTGPTLEAELEVSEYARDGATRDDMRATIYFDVPLYSGKAESSALKLARARHRQALADMQKSRSEMRITVLKLWQEIQQNGLRLAGELVNQEYRDMALDRSRTEYQLEFKADLGDSMVEYSNSRMLAYQARFALEMAWRKLEKLLGSEYIDKMRELKVNNG